MLREVAACVGLRRRHDYEEVLSELGVVDRVLGRWDVALYIRGRLRGLVCCFGKRAVLLRTTERRASDERLAMVDKLACCGCGLCAWLLCVHLLIMMKLFLN